MRIDFAFDRVGVDLGGLGDYKVSTEVASVAPGRGFYLSDTCDLISCVGRLPSTSTSCPFPSPTQSLSDSLGMKGRAGWISLTVSADHPLLIIGRWLRVYSDAG